MQNTMEDEVVFVSFVPYEPPTCPICFGAITAPGCAIFRCKHKMHAACFIDFRKAGYERCPMCRRFLIPPTKCRAVLKTRRLCKNAAVNGTEFCRTHERK